MLLLLAHVAVASAASREERAAELSARALEDGLPPHKVLKLADRALRLDPDNVEAHFAKAQAFAWMASMLDGGVTRDMLEALARAEWEAIVLLEPQSRLGAIARDALATGPQLEIAEPECPPEAREAYLAAERALGAGDRAAARAAYTQALEGCPDNAVWWVHAGDAWFPEDLPAALERYDRGIELVPCHWQGHRFRSDALAHLGQHDEAWRSAVRAVACNPQYEAGWNDAIALTHQLGGRVVQAGPILPPRSADEADGHAAWAAWWARREAGLAGAEDAAAAVRAGLEAGPPSGDPSWALLARLADAGVLEDAVLVLLYEPALAEALIRANHERPDAVPALITTHLLVR